MKTTKRQRRRRILLLADFAYTSGKAVAAGVIRFVSSHPELDLMLHGRNSETTLMQKGLVPVTGIDGIVSCFGNDLDFMRDQLDSVPGVPVVFASLPRGWTPPTGRHSAAIFCDQSAVSEAAAELFLRHGLSEFGYVGSRNEEALRTWDAERRDAFRDFLVARGFRTSVYLPPSGADADAELASLTVWLRSLPKPCGLLVSNDIRAMHVLNTCRTEGIAVPEQIQVIGADNEEWICDRTFPSLTSVEPDFEGCGHRAAETLLAMMDGGPWEREQTFGVKRVEQRMSTTDIHGSTNRAVRAREYLRTHSSEPLSTVRLAAILGCSPRLLQLSYKAVFGCTVQEDLLETRLNLARKLLAENRVPICDIPERVGFESPFHFMKLFKKHTGMTMLQWRKRGGT